MADYWTHWLSMEGKVAKPPRIYRVNWFRKDQDGTFMWPGYGENMRVLKWIIDRVSGNAQHPAESPFGYVPHYEDVTWSGIEFSMERFEKIMAVDQNEAIAEAEDQEKLFTKFGRRMPAVLERERKNLLRKLHEGKFARVAAKAS